MLAITMDEQLWIEQEKKDILEYVEWFKGRRLLAEAAEVEPLGGKSPNF